MSRSTVMTMFAKPCKEAGAAPMSTAALPMSQIRRASA